MNSVSESQLLAARSIAWRLLPALLVASGSAEAALADSAASKRFFAQRVQPILSDKCFHCHGPDEAQRPTDMRLDTEEGVAQAFAHGVFDDSEAWRRIESDDEYEVMPPPELNKAFSQEELATIREWMESGATWSRHWAFEPPARVEPPVGHGTHPVDAFVRQKLAAAGLAASGPTTREKLLRRATFDLHGLPPTTEEIEAFLADDAPGAWGRVLDRLFASPRYGERMAVAWLDGARYADTNGYQNDFKRMMWPWRDWVINAFNRNQPFDEFTIEQLAGDMLPNPTREQRIATGFNRNNRTVTEAGSITEEWHVENVADRVDATSSVFLGLTMACARCHDHKYDPISQRDFFSFFAFFNSVNERGVYKETRGNVGPTIRLGTEEQLEELDELRDQFDSMDVLLSTAKSVAQIARSPGPTLAGVHAGVVARERRRAERRWTERRDEIPSTMVMEELPERRPTFLLNRGEYDKPDKSQPVDPATPSFLRQLPEGRADRLALAEWIVSRDNPLTARVTVNRLWSQFFGVGLVKSEENFGVQSDPPSHPDLLDWLAVELIDSGWDLQHVMRLILTSETYAQSSAATPEAFAQDPENRLLARGPRRRLSAEFVRDQALAVSGLLNEKIGGPSVRPYQPEGLWEEIAGGAGEGPYVQSHGSDLYRRSLYTYRKRTVPHPTMSTFDSPSFEVCTVRRSTTNTPLQALALLNDVTYVEAARLFAERLLTEGGADAESRLRFGWRLVTSRLPDADELATLVAALERQIEIFRTDPEAAAKLLATGEAPRDESLDAPELAAYATIGGLLLNLDETITVE